MSKDKDSRRRAALRKLKSDMEKDKADSKRVSKWLKLMESKKRLFALEDEIDKINRSLKNKQ